MRVLIQRVANASVTIEGKVKSEIGQGLLLFAGFEPEDNDEDVEWITGKISRLRIFNDADGVMNLSVQDVKGEILVISQFTLHASVKKGNRPSYFLAAEPKIAIPLYDKFLTAMETTSGMKVLSGEFGADMKVNLLNDGPVTIFIDSKRRE